MAKTKQQVKKNASSPKIQGSAKKNQFNIKQKSQSPFSTQSQAKKMKVKTSQNKTLRKNVPREVLQDNSKVAALEKQIKSMQDKIRLIEKNQRKIQDTRKPAASQGRVVTRKMAREEQQLQANPRGAKSKKKLSAPMEGASSARTTGRKRKSEDPEDVESKLSIKYFHQ